MAVDNQLYADFSRAALRIARLDALQEALQEVVLVARRYCQADVALLILEPQEMIADTLFSSGIDEEVLARLRQEFSGEEAASELKGPLGPRAKEVLRVDALPREKRFPVLTELLPAAGSLLAVPIIIDGAVYGRLTAIRHADHPPFTELETNLLDILTGHAGVAIKNAELLYFNRRQRQYLERQNKQLAVLDKATMAIAGELALENVLQQIIDSARDLVDAQYGALGVPNQQGYMETFVTSGMAPVEMEAIPHLPEGKGLLGAIVRERRTIRIPRIGDDPRSVGFPINHPPMAPFLGVPVEAGGEVLGNLYMTNKLNGDEFTENDQHLVELLAAHAAIAIQNARLYEQVGRLAIVEERNRIGMDLHDGVIQSIFAVGLTLESAKLSMGTNGDEAAQLLEHAITGLNDTIRDIRNYILDLRPHRFRGNLEAGLGRLMREFQANTMVPVGVKGDLKFTLDLPSDVARAIFLTTQEALANIARHAKATNVQIEIQQQDNDFVMTITDDGQGFDVRGRNYSIGHGLSNMRMRAEDLNGRYKIRSRIGQGTTVTLRLPIS